MKIAVRVDASREIGTGHFVRCLTLADALRARGGLVRFVSRQLPEHLKRTLALRGHQFARLDPASTDAVTDELSHAPWLGTSQQADAQATIAALSDVSWDWMVIDHYALDARWESAIRSVAKKVFVIDDIADRTHDCDGLLDQNHYGNMDSRYIGKVPHECRLNLGPRFALLREEFHGLHERVQPRAGPLQRVLVFLGGMDADDYTSRAIEALSVPELAGLSVDVVIGAGHPERVRIDSTCRERGFTCHVQTERMAELIASADLAIGAGGSATWERCCLGLPALTVSLSQNQVDIAKGLDALGAGRYLGTPDVASVSVLQHAVAGLRHDSSRLHQLSANAYALVDGLGAGRICETMIS